MPALTKKIISAEKRFQKEITALSLILLPFTLIITVLGASSCALSRTFTASCLTSTPVVYSAIVALTFILAFQATHYIVEFIEYRKKNQQLPLKKAVKISVKQTENADLAETIEHFIQPVVQRIEGKTGQTDREDDPPVEIT